MKKSLRILISILILFVAVQVISLILNNGLTRFGVYPRDLSTLPYIYLAPFIHGSWQHLTNNIIVFALFSFLILEEGPRYYLKSSFFIITLSGVLVWLLARPASHVGASGWIFGFFGLLIARAWYQRSIKNFLIALFILLFYGGMITGIFPNQRSISFEYHIAGVLSGVLFSRSLSKNRRYKRSTKKR